LTPSHPLSLHDALPIYQTFIDHLGVPHVIDTRNDFHAHRIMVFLKGWIALPKLRYQIILWTVNTTDQKAIFAVLGYQFSKKFSVDRKSTRLNSSHQIIS